jgi:hypothetical protein
VTFKGKDAVAYPSKHIRATSPHVLDVCTTTDLIPSLPRFSLIAMYKNTITRIVPADAYLVVPCV